MTSKKSSFERWVERNIDGNITRNLSLVIKEQFTRLMTDLYEAMFAAVKSNPTNPKAALNLPNEIKRRLCDIFHKIYDIPATGKRESSYKKKNSSAVKAVYQTYSRADLIAIMESDRIFSRFDAARRMVLNIDIQSLLSGESKLGSVPSQKELQTIYKADIKTQKRLDIMRKNAVRATGKRELNRTVSYLEKSFNKWGITFDHDVIENNLISTQSLSRASVNDVLSDTSKLARMMVDNGGYTGSQIQYAVSKRIQELSPNISNSYAQGCARTIVNSTYNQTIVSQMDKAIKSNVVKKTAFKSNRVSYKFSAILDNRTSDICRHLNGKIILATDKSTLSRCTPPLHFRCRSILVPNLKG